MNVKARDSALGCSSDIFSLPQNLITVQVFAFGWVKMSEPGTFDQNFKKYRFYSDVQHFKLAQASFVPTQK
jgi:hypothetical protein